MSKMSLFPLFAIAFVAACGTNDAAREKTSLETSLSSQYNDHDAAAEVDEQKFGSYLLDSYDEKSLSLTSMEPTMMGVPLHGDADVEVEKKPDKEGVDKPRPEKMAERMQKIKGEKESREGKQKEHEKGDKGEKEKSAEKEKPAFRLALEGSRQYVMALIGLDNSPFEKFRAALAEAKASAKSEEEFKAKVEELSKTFKEEKAAAWTKAEAGRTEHKVEIDAIRASRKDVVAACAVSKGKESEIKMEKPEKMKPEEALKTMPSAEEIAARKIAKEAEHKDSMEKHEDRKFKAESAECTTATSALKALTAQK